MSGLHVDDITRIELAGKASVRELDQLRTDMRDKADRTDVTYLATSMSNEQMSAMERYRTVQASIGEVERAVKALADVVAQQSGMPSPRAANFLGRMPPQFLLAGGVALGALAIKSPEVVTWIFHQ